MRNWLDEVEKDIKVAMILSLVSGVSWLMFLILTVWALNNQ